MNDPHVVALTYRVEHSAHVDFKTAPPRTVDRPAFRVTLDAGKARVKMLEHFATEKEARDAVKPFLDAWELAADLEYPRDRFRFTFERAEVIDRRPPEGDARIRVGGEKLAFIESSVTHLGRGSWPEPPAEIALTPDVEALHTRWLGHLDKKEPLLSAAYWALTMIEAAPGSRQPDERLRITKRRRHASEFFKIELEVLSTIGHLTANRGGVDEGRKAEGRGKELSPNERRWLEAGFKALVERAALQAYYGKPPPTPLTMKDLPDITPGGS